MSRVSRSRPIAFVPSRCPGLPGPRFGLNTGAWVVGASTGANSAVSTSSTTMTSPVMAAQLWTKRRNTRRHGVAPTSPIGISSCTGASVISSARTAGSNSMLMTGPCSSEPHLRVEVGVEDVDGEVEHDEDQRAQQHDALDHGEVLVEQRQVEVPTHAVEREDLLDDHRAAEHVREADAEHRHRRE